MIKHTKKGFTIVELLIVIVVIAILATISIVAYNGVQQRANRSVRIQDHKALVTSFEAYKAAYGDYPPASDGGYCIGQGFSDVDSDGIGDCRNTTNATYRHSYSASITDELAKVAPYTPSQPTRPNPNNVHVGPFVTYSSSHVAVHNFYYGTGDCPEGSGKWWSDASSGGTYVCQFILPK